MGSSSSDTSNNRKKQLCLGIVAHVDAGKTTLSEALLYVSGSIRTLGRVDHRDAFLDTNGLERARGITIFAKEARLSYRDTELTLLDTPGHADFSAEMERTLRVLDYAVLVVSGADGVQGHTETLWRLLGKYRIPVFLFVNKMDQPGTDREERLAELRKRLDAGCIPFDGGLSGEAWMEELAMTDEAAMERYLEDGELSEAEIRRLIKERRVFPCYFGSAIKLAGVEALLAGLVRYGRQPDWPEQFGARVFKISRDAQGNRLTHLKITGGSLRVKSVLPNGEKADQLRRYSGAKFETAEEASAGTVCAVTGPLETYPGQGLGIEPDAEAPVLAPVLRYRIGLPEGCDVQGMFRKLLKLQEEEPMLRIVWEETLGEIYAQVMGEVQIEILRSVIADRYGVDVAFDSGNIVYKETIQGTAEGVGHYEPLRHYAEVHILLEEGEPGSGLVFDTCVSEDVLDGNWQRLILTHLAEKAHVGVLTGSEITDMKLTLAAGKAHLKHTEGGDFRQAAYRAVRQGLRRARSVLLEPVYAFRLEVPAETVGRAMSDIQRMGGSFDGPVQEGETAVLEGSVPAAELRSYQTEVAAYTKGRGRLFCELKGYEPCHNAEEVIAARGYEADRDPDNPTGSIFCARGAGYYVPWDQVEEQMHLEAVLKPGRPEAEFPADAREPEQEDSGKKRRPFGQEEKELAEIFARTYGGGSTDPFRRLGGDSEGGFWRRTQEAPDAEAHSRERKGESGKPPARNARTESERKRDEEEYLLVDGYNIIFAWEELRELAEENLAGARGRLMDILSNYQGYRRQTLILVFDAYKVEGGSGQVLRYHNIHVVYTKEAETADQYIEKTVHRIGRKHRVTVATSDALEQVIILGQGAGRMSAQGLWEEIQAAGVELRQTYLSRRDPARNYLFDYLPREHAQTMEEVRLGRRTLSEEQERE